jgi:hypothetical protein
MFLVKHFRTIGAENLTKRQYDQETAKRPTDILTLEN